MTKLKTILIRTFCALSIWLSATATLVAEDGKLTGTDLRLMAYNIHHGEGTDGKFDLKRLADVIVAEKPDLVAVQEVDVKTGRSSGVDQAAELGRLTGMHYAFGKFMDYDGGDYGQMVLSRFPITNARNLALPKGPEPRTALVVEVAVPIGGEQTEPLFFVGVHFYATEAQRSAQAAQLSALLQPELEKGLPIIVAGDFNSTPGSKPMEIMAKHWVDPTADRDERTWPSDLPKVEIDHILHFPAKRFRFVDSKVVPERVASDHRPVVSSLQLLPSSD